MRPYPILLLLLFCNYFAFTQNAILKGKVIASDNGSPIIGAMINVPNTDLGTVTDIDGLFALTTSEQHKQISVSYIGYTTKEVILENFDYIEITLDISPQMMDEVIVVGYKKEIRTDVSSAVTSLKSKDINKLVVSGIDQALQGQAAGVSVTQVTGSPGDDIAVRIRGVGTLGNNNPLYVIDGIPTTGGLNMFSLGDIASIEVLKDAAAAAIYGARAANGVVLITTKRGKNEKPVFTFESFYGIQQANGLPKLLNAKDYLTIRNEAITNANTLRNVANQIPTYDTAILDTLPDNDWLDIMFNPASMQRYALSARGGSENSNYYMSGEYFTQEGIFKGQNFDKYQVRINAETNKGRFRVGNNFVFAHTNRKVINGSGDGFGPGNELSGIRYTLITAPVFKMNHSDGRPVNVSTELGDPTLYGDGNPNPLLFVNSTDWTIKKYRVFGNVFAELDLIKGLKIRSTLGGDLNFDNEKLFKERLSAAIYSPTSLNEGRVFNNTFTWNNTIDFERKFGKHKISTLVGMEAIDNHTDYLGASANNFRKSDPLFRYLSASTPVELKNLGVSGIATEWSLLSYFAQANYVFGNKYVLSGTIRRDGSSRFGNNNRWAVFPSASAAWNVTNENFFPKNTPISAMKIRASWGQLGNQEIGIYPYSSLVSAGEFVYVFDDEIATGATIKETGNSNIKWETSTQSNLGLDLSLWNDRLTLNIDYFKKLTEDILVRVPIPQSGGGSRPPLKPGQSLSFKLKNKRYFVVRGSYQ